MYLLYNSLISIETILGDSVVSGEGTVLRRGKKKKKTNYPICNDLHIVVVLVDISRSKKTFNTIWIDYGNLYMIFCLKPSTLI